MKRSRVIGSLVAVALGCTVGALALLMSDEAAAARQLAPSELSGIVGGNEEGEFFQNKTCHETFQCHHLNFPGGWCGVGPGVGEDCDGCEEEEFVDHTCLAGGNQDCRLGGVAGDIECGKKTTGECTAGFVCAMGTVDIPENFCECDARDCRQE